MSQRIRPRHPQTIEPSRTESIRNRRFVRRRELRTPGNRSLPIRSVAELLERFNLIKAMHRSYPPKIQIRQFRSATEFPYYFFCWPPAPAASAKGVLRGHILPEFLRRKLLQVHDS